MKEAIQAGEEASAPIEAARFDTVSAALGLLRVGPILILVLILVVLSFLSPYFMTSRNVGNILAQTAVIATVAMGQQLVILTRGIDLSVGSTLALASVVGALVFRVVGFCRRWSSGDARDRRSRRLGQWRRLCLRPPAAPVHHHAGDAERRQGAGARTVGRACAPGHAGGDPLHRA